MVYFAKIAAHFLIWKKKMNDNSCRSICGYYDVKSENRSLQNNIFRKYCSVCNLELISRYSSCPCCHKSFGSSGK